MREQPFWVSCSSTAIRRLPFGRYQLANALGRFAGQPFRAQLPGDLGRLSFTCDLRDTIAREVCFTGRYEPQETQLAQDLLGPGMVVVDVGANWGYFTLVCAHLVADRGRVIALEPHPRLASMLADNVKENRLPQVAVHCVAAGARSASTAFVGFDEGGGNWGVSRAAQGLDVPDFESKTVAIRYLPRRVRCGPGRSHQIDIEGAEGDALRGMAEGLVRHRYRYALVECHPAELTRIGTSVAEVLTPFRTAGYRGWHIDHSPEMHRRAASGAVPAMELLAPIDERALGSDDWPHLLWVAPGEAVPA